MHISIYWCRRASHLRNSCSIIVQYALRNGKEADIYLDVPVPQALTIGNTLSNIQKILHETGEMFEILEWKDQELHILDPYFLFYIRWHEE